MRYKIYHVYHYREGYLGTRALILAVRIRRRTLDGPFEGLEEGLTELEALRKINHWNSQTPGIWIYWL